MIKIEVDRTGNGNYEFMFINSNHITCFFQIVGIGNVPNVRILVNQYGSVYYKGTISEFVEKYPEVKK